jgi:hypothetical protein
VSEYVSLKHVTHTLLPASANVPRAHGEHAALPAALKVSLLHATHTPPAPYVPAAHGAVGQAAAFSALHGCACWPAA